MDLEMPVLDGWEATRRLRGNPQTRDIPIIALSAHALAGERDKALAVGCDEFDTKPIEFDRLVATVRRILARWRKPTAAAPDRRRWFRVIKGGRS
jgi:CheY-like chemotaxis protein